jgi:hypothetical protein
MSNDLMLQSGSPSAMTAEKRRLKAEDGVRNLQIIGALSLYQGHQLSKSVQNLNANFEHQTALLENIAGGIGIVASKIDDVKHEQVLQRLKQEREETAKEAVFQFKQECDRLGKEPQGFNTYFHYRALEATLIESDISSRDLSTIADKEYLAQVETSLTEGMERSLAAFTATEQADFEAFEELTDYEFEDIDALQDSRARKLATQFERIRDNPHIISQSDLEEALGEDLRPLNLGEYYKGTSYVKWPLGTAIVIGAAGWLLLPDGRESAFPLAVAGWIVAFAVVAVVNGFRRVFTSHSRLLRIKKQVLDQVQADKSFLFADAAKDEESLKGVLAEVERRREVACEIVNRHAFMKAPLEPYLRFSTDGTSRA